MSITRTTWTDGSTVINNTRLQAIYQAIEDWGLDTYTPAITGSTSSPSLGNGSASGKYLEIGDVVLFVAKWAAGSTTTFGSGNYSISLPVSAVTTWPGNITVFVQDASAGGAIFNGRAFVSTTTTALLLTTTEAAASAAGSITPTAPITFANGDIIHAVGVYFRA